MPPLKRAKLEKEQKSEAMALKTQPQALIRAQACSRLHGGIENMAVIIPLSTPDARKPATKKPVILLTRQSTQNNPGKPHRAKKPPETFVAESASSYSRPGFNPHKRNISRNSISSRSTFVLFKHRDMICVGVYVSTKR